MNMDVQSIIELVYASVVRALSVAPWWACLPPLFLLAIRLTFGRFSHMEYVVAAWFRLRKLKRIGSPAQQFGYLRKTNPFVFEEMILTALKKNGHKITRNLRYTGDGGIDGRAVINGRKVLIQAKRYKNHITAAHVFEFSNICKRKGHEGLFIHTGRTGKLAKTECFVDIVSGSRMLELLTQQGFSPRW